MSEILVVTGLPRSGTSLMMQIIDRSGFPILSDGKREKDISNPQGYFELEAVKGIVRDNSFLGDAEGKAIKVVAPLPMFFNLKHTYRVLFMRREMDEILRSQETMLQKDQSAEREKFKTIYEGHLAKTYSFFENNNIEYLDVNYNELMNSPEKVIQEVQKFCELKGDLNDLIAVVKPELYRNRG